MGNYLDYFITIIGLCIIMVSLFLIFSDKLKGEGLYFDLYVKEQEIKKSIIEAEEMIDELRYTSESIVNEIETGIKEYKQHHYQLKEISIPKVSYTSTMQNPSKVKEYKKAKSDTDSFKSIKKENITEKSQKVNTIINYYNEGMEVGEIAKKMNIGKGEVSLILSINNEVLKNGNV